MSSYNKKRGHSYYRRKCRAKRTEPYRPWNAAALGKPISKSIYDSEIDSEIGNFISEDKLIDDKQPTFDNTQSTQFRPWNEPVLNKIDITKNGNTAVTTSQQSILSPEQPNQNNFWNQQNSQYQNNNLQYNTIEDLNPINLDDFTMLEEAKLIMEIQRLK
ncbi:hypothetical protein C1645_804717, partial [Glomus cerebriforme]